MRLIEVLPDYEAKKFDKPPTLSNDEQQHYFRLDDPIAELIKGVEAHHKIGILLQHGYFKASKKFYTQQMFKLADIKFVAKLLGLPVPRNFSSEYSDRARQRHRLSILESCGYVEFSSAETFFEELVQDMVAQQMHPRKLFYFLVEKLRNKKIELPSYDRIVRTITEKFNGFEKKVLQTMAHVITPEQQEALEQMISTTGDHYQRTLLTRLKCINQSMRPRKIKHGMRNFLIIKKLFKELKPVIKSLSLSSEATQYYAQWAVKAKATQITDIIDPHKRYLYLITFIDHYYKVWQDTLVDMLLRCVQQQLNKVDKELNIMVKGRLLEKNKLTSSVLSGFHETKKTIETVRKTLHNDILNNDEKIKKLYEIVPKEAANLSLIQAEKDAEQLKIQLDSEETQEDQFDILSNFSRKLQNRVADIVKNIDFEPGNTADALYAAITHYQSENLTPTSPDEFLNEHEYNAIHKDGKFNVSLYKAILFCKISNAIKSGQLNLLSSYRYLSIDDYLIDEAEWGENKQLILERLGLSHFENIEGVLSTLRELLTKQFIDVNQRIIQGENKYVTIKKDGTFSLHTPPIQKPDYDAISVIIGKDRYIPILQMMTEMNALCNFTSNFKHYKIKGAKEKPENEIFYAGIFALGSKIGLHKLANTAVGINYHTLSNVVNWYFSLDNLYMVNQTLIDLISKLWLPGKFKREKNLLHTSSDGQKKNVSVDSLNANYSYKYHGNGRGASIYNFIDERGILFYTTVFSSSEREAAYVIDGLLHNEIIQSDMHSTDTHGYTEMIFAISHLIGVTFAPRIKDIASVNLVSFEKIKSVANNNYPIKPDHYVKENKIARNWDNILRLVATIMLRKHRASTILKRLSGYANQHPLQEALKEFGRIIKSIFALKYIDDVTWRQMIEKQLNKGELANKFASAVSFADQEIAEAYQNDQEISALCKTIIQNIIILWNYIELTKIIMRSDKAGRGILLDDITSASILTWRHVNLHGTYDFSNLTAANDSGYSLEEVVAFKAA